MSHIQVKQKYRVTIPLSIRKKISLREGDLLEVVEKDGLILLIPESTTNKLPDAHKRPSLMSLFGVNAGSGLYSSAKDIDQTICELRGEW